MADYFDTNVARRKPNTAEKNQPIHPWDIPKIPPLDSSVDVQIPTSVPFTPVQDIVVPEPTSTHKSDPAPSPSVQPDQELIRPFDSSVVDTPASRRRKSDLSDSINIHSNFCKLDNDISDILLQRLSASAQSVYIRLYRQSYGWNRNWAAESLPKLTEFCNLSLQTVRKAIKELEHLGCIRKEFSDYHRATVYRVFLPSEIGIAKSTSVNSSLVYSSRLNINSLSASESSLTSQNIDSIVPLGQVPDGDSSCAGPYQIPDGNVPFSWGQIFNTQSVYFSGTSICNILESGGSLPKNISKYITNTHIESAVSIIDEFYDSIGFSVVSRSLYRKSLLDYFEMIKSGFSSDDIRYAVRWTFKNSRSRPESFSLIKHTMHLAMSDLIQELKTVSGETELAREKQEALRKTIDLRNHEPVRSVTPEDMKTWLDVVDMLRNSLNEHSFSAFIEPLHLDEVEGGRVVLSSPSDSVSWVIDHYVERIRDSYRECTGKDVVIEVR